MEDNNQFGQLISNVLGDKDNFYTEDDEMIKKFEAYFSIQEE